MSLVFQDGCVAAAASAAQIVDLLEEATLVVKLVDVGHSISYRISHPNHGDLIVVNSSEGDSLVFVV